MKKRRRRGFMIVVLVASVIAFAGAAGAAVPGAADDVRFLAAEIERLHPSPFHDVDAQQWRAAASSLAAQAGSLERDQLVVELMRLVALLGEREGHSGIVPGAAHQPPLRLYPLKLYDFSDGLFVIGARGAPDTVGARLVAVNGVSVADVVRRVAPLVPRDNVWSLRNLLPEFMVTAEVLSGLGIAPRDRATFTLDRGGVQVAVALEPIPAAQYLAALHHPWQLTPPPGVRTPLYLQKQHVAWGVTVIQKGRVVYVTYNGVTGDTESLARRVLRLARAKAFRRLIVDARLNGGGNNQRNHPLITMLRTRAVRRHVPPVVITGRATFSAGKDFVVDAEQYGGARLVGEPTGGALKQWGDSVPVQLPSVGVTVFVATSYVAQGRADDFSVTQEPDVRVELSSADWFAGRDPVLDAALRVTR